MTQKTIAEQSTGDRLSEKLIAFSDSLEKFESFNLHLLMSVAMGGIAPRGNILDAPTGRPAWHVGISVLGHLASSGLAFRGVVPFVVDEYLPSIRKEAEVQEGISHRTGPHTLSPGGAVAAQLAHDERLIAFVAQKVGQSLRPTGISSYLYYNQTGDHLYPHVDTEIFAVNFILMVKHDLPEGRTDGSALVIFDADHQAKRVPLDVGESVVIRASGTVHGREAVGEGERVTILTIGFEDERARVADA